jgi:hypothetical protein
MENLMCDDAKVPNQSPRSEHYGTQAKQANPLGSDESHMVYELKQQREYYIKKLVTISVAIDAINQI